MLVHILYKCHTGITQANRFSKQGKYLKINLGKNNAMNPIKKLIEEKGNKRVSDLLAPYFDDIERAMESGLSHQQILEGLADLNINITINTFRTTLYRMRNARSKDKKNVTLSNSSVVQLASQIPDEKKNFQEKPSDSSQSKSSDLKSWREMRKQHVEW